MSYTKLLIMARQPTFDDDILHQGDQLFFLNITKEKEINKQPETEIHRIIKTKGVSACIHF